LRQKRLQTAGNSAVGFGLTLAPDISLVALEGTDIYGFVESQLPRIIRSAPPERYSGA
jgi:hypothetical protein